MPINEDIRLTLVIRRPLGDESAEEKGHGYLGLQMATLKPRPGDNWPTGEDATQGPHDEATLERIFQDITNYFHTGARELAAYNTSKEPANGDHDQHDRPEQKDEQPAQGQKEGAGSRD